MSEQRRHSAGWWVGAAVFWLLTAWLITVGLSSIIPQIFQPGGAPDGAGSCANELRRLKQELLERTSASMAAAPAPGERDALTQWLLAWDERMRVVRPTCNQRELSAWDDLSRLRHGMRSLVDRFDHEQAARVRRLDALLGTTSGAQAP